jgi:hypothetical protein
LVRRRAYVAAVRTILASQATSISPGVIERWSMGACAGGRIDPVKAGLFLEQVETGDYAN